MNIFVTNESPVISAFDLPDKLIVKMPTESLQLLTPWAYNTHGVYTIKPDGTTYGIKGFAHHPCAKWLYESPANVWWLWCHASAMCGAYSIRYKKPHGTLFGLKQIKQLLVEHHPDYYCDQHTEFVQAMPDEFKVPGNAVQAYRNYINGYKGYAVWNYSEKPTWWDEEKHEPVRKQYLAERESKKLKRQHEKYQKLSTTLQS